ncbi:MAG TPA: hydroxyacylglutathione hydrolase [Stellaceae bacterium]|nr:hydroxyacylglutathione hydrolase [Stellaceae bacterium]
MTELTIRQIPVLRDNYVYLIRDPDTDATGVVDPSVAAPVLDVLKETGWRLTHILNTHHHADHTGGNLELKQATSCIIVGPRADRDRIPGIDLAVGDGDTYQFGQRAARVFDVPGHTRGHIAYWFADSRALFCGDTLFIMGCGRLFEGTPAQMWDSLGKLKGLPAETRVYCGHEYTQNNARFALTVDPDNAALRARAQRVDALRAQNLSTVPGTIGEELLTNPFLRADQKALQEVAGTVGDPIATLAAIRHRKDNF